MPNPVFFPFPDISIHALRTEGDTDSLPRSRPIKTQHISIHALRTEGDVSDFHRVITLQQFLSTPSVRRATKSGCDKVLVLTDFYPRPPYGGRPAMCRCFPAMSQFLSTPSVRRATQHDQQETEHDNQFLSTPSVRRATSVKDGRTERFWISIHALRTEGDRPAPASSGRQCYFYPRPPYGGRPDSP